MKMFTLLPIAVFRQQPEDIVLAIHNTFYLPNRGQHILVKKKLSGTHVPIVFHNHFYFKTQLIFIDDFIGWESSFDNRLKMMLARQKLESTSEPVW